jgi:hypothetical protein
MGRGTHRGWRRERKALPGPVTCADLIGWAERRRGTQFAVEAEAAGFSRAPGALAGQASLAIDYRDFADAAGSTQSWSPPRPPCGPWNGPAATRISSSAARRKPENVHARGPRPGRRR